MVMLTLEIANYDANSRMVAGMKPAEFAELAKTYGLECSFKPCTCKS